MHYWHSLYLDFTHISKDVNISDFLCVFAHAHALLKLALMRLYAYKHIIYYFK